MARKKKSKVKSNVDSNRGADRRAGERRANNFWSKVENAFERFGKTSKLIQENSYGKNIKSTETG